MDSVSEKCMMRKKKHGELLNDNYTSCRPEGLKWRDWAVDRKDGERHLQGMPFLTLSTTHCSQAAKNLEIDETTPMSQVIVRYAFEDANNYQKDGVLLRQVVNIIDEIDFTEYKERHEFGCYL